MRRTPLGHSPPAAGSASNPPAAPRSRVEGRSVAEEAPAELRKAGAANARRGNGAGPPPQKSFGTTPARFAGGSHPGPPRRAPAGTSDLSAASAERGFNVSDPSGDGAPADVTPFPRNLACLGNSVAPLAPAASLALFSERAEEGPAGKSEKGRKKPNDSTTLSGGSLGSCVDEERS